MQPKYDCYLDGHVVMRYALTALGMGPPGNFTQRNIPSGVPHATADVMAVETHSMQSQVRLPSATRGKSISSASRTARPPVAPPVFPTEIYANAPLPPPGSSCQESCGNYSLFPYKDRQRKIPSLSCLHVQCIFYRDITLVRFSSNAPWKCKKRFLPDIFIEFIGF